MCNFRGFSFPLVWIWIIYIFAIFTFCSATSATAENSRDLNVNVFLIRLLHQELGDCSVFLVEVEVQVEFEFEFDRNSNRKPIKYVSELENTWGEILSNLPPSQVSFVVSLKEQSQDSGLDSGGNFSTTISKRLELMRDVHQRRDSCTVGIFILPQFTKSRADFLYREMTKWSNFIKKDEDYHVFLATTTTTSTAPTDNDAKDKDTLAKETLREELLVSSDISKGIKYKILIQEAQKSNRKEDFLVSTACFYCDSSGRSRSVGVHWGEILPSASRDTFSFIFAPLPTIFPNFAKNFHGKTFTVGTPTGTRWLNEIILENGSWVAKRGIYKITMDNLMLKYNFSCHFFPSKGGGGTGYRFKNGTWVGSVGSVVDGLSEIGHVTGQTWSRNKAVGFTYPVSYEMLSFTTAQPLPFFSWKAIFWPLASSMWIGLGVSFIFANFTLLLVVKYTKDKFSLTNILTYTLASVLEQDMPAAERLSAAPIRIFVCFWLFFTLVVSTAYRSKLVSLMSFPNVEEPPRSFEELANSNYKFALQYLRGAAYALLKTSPNPTYMTIFSRMELEEDDVRCFERVIGQRFVCISWSRIADFIFVRNLTDQYGRAPVVRAPDTTCFLSVGIIMEKRAVILGSFNELIIHATDSGLLEKWWGQDMQYVYAQRRRWEREVNKTTHNYEKEESDALTTKHFRGSFFLLSTGSLMAMVVFLAEWVCNWNKRRGNLPMHPPIILVGNRGTDVDDVNAASVWRWSSAGNW